MTAQDKATAARRAAAWARVGYRPRPRNPVLDDINRAARLALSALVCAGIPGAEAAALAAELAGCAAGRYAAALLDGELWMCATHGAAMMRNDLSWTTPGGSRCYWPCLSCGCLVANPGELPALAGSLAREEVGVTV